MSDYAWPSDLKPISWGFWPENADRSGGVTMAGGEQVVTSPGGRWRASGLFAVRTKAQVLALRALALNAQGRANNILVPGFDGRRLSWPLEAYNGELTGRILTPGVTRRRQLDGTIYEDPEIPAASAIHATVNTNAAIRATTLLINRTQGAAFVAGQFFGIGTRLYGIASIAGVAGAVTTCVIWPPLRAAATATTPVLFTRPVCVMRLADPQGLLKELQLLSFADLQVEFVEVL